MKRILPSFCMLLLLTGCEKSWKNIIIKKRLYMDGYYVHVPSKRFSEKHAYMPPSQYPTIAERDAAVKHFADSVLAHDVPEKSVQPLYDTMPGPIAYVYTPYRADTIFRPYSYYTHRDTVIVRRDTVHTLVHRDTIIYMVHRDTIFNIIHRDTFLVMKHDTIIPIVQRDSIIPYRDTLGMANHDSLRGSDSTRLAALEKPRKPINWPEGEWQGYFQGGLYNGPQSAGYPVQWNSFSTAAGLRYKMDMKKRKELVFDFGYRFNRIYPGQNKPKQAPFLVDHYDREHLTMHDITGAICGRYNFRHADDKPQHWMDVGVYGDCTVRNKEVGVNIDENSPLGDRVKTKIKVTGLSYLKDLNYGVTARIGKGIYSGFIMYRLNDLTSFGNDAADVPKFILGVDITLAGE